MISEVLSSPIELSITALQPSPWYIIPPSSITSYMTQASATPLVKSYLCDQTQCMSVYCMKVFPSKTFDLLSCDWLKKVHQGFSCLSEYFISLSFTFKSDNIYVDMWQLINLAYQIPYVKNHSIDVET